jgi:GxxExxY protein
MLEEELTGQIIKVFYKVYNALGHGFLESIYHNAMILELVDQGLTVETEKPIAVYYSNRIVGSFSVDLLVHSKVMIELKATDSIHPAHEAQLTNYLRATEIEVGLLFNFGKKAEFKRKYFSNEKKQFTIEAETLNSSLNRSILENPF